MPSIIETREEQHTHKEPRPRRRGYRGPRIVTILLSTLLFIVLVHFLIVWKMPAPSAPTTCAGLIRSTDYTQVIHLQPQSQEMQAIQYTSQLTGGQPSALVQVMGTDAQHTLDVYVYGCTMRQDTPQLAPWFTQRGLLQGTASVSQANTLVTGELDTNLSTLTTTLIDPLQQNIYREYAWQNGSFVQIAFPTLYPVTNRSEAELLQQQATSGQSLPWTNPQVTAQQMAKDILKWPGGKATLVNNDGTTAHVLLTQQQPHFEVTVTLKQLLPHNTNTGIWFVVSAQTARIVLGQVGNQAQGTTVQVSSPVVIQGTGAVPGGQTTLALLDHTLLPLSLLDGSALNVDASGTYAATVLYTNSQQDQPGLLLIQSLPPDGSNLPGQLLLAGVIIG